MRSLERLLTTHVGSLPRPAGFVAETEGEHALADAVDAVVRHQCQAGIDIVSDGDMGKPDYATYVAARVSGFGGQGRALAAPSSDAVEFPDWGSDMEASHPGPACVGELTYLGDEAVRRDIQNLDSAARREGASDAFLTAASPGVLTTFFENQHYPTHEAYLAGLATAMRPEYLAIHEAGITLQLDCPDLTAIGRQSEFANVGLREWRSIMALHIEALNAATDGIPPEAMRLHLCWGNYEGPHTHDVALRDILDVVFRARPSMIAFEAANPRHEHEWAIFADVKLPDDKVLIPGVIDSTTNYVEHPELVSQRLVRLAKLVGREHVIAGVDCGFGTFSEYLPVFPTVVYAKLKSLVDGAEIASRELW